MGGRAEGLCTKGGHLNSQVPICSHMRSSVAFALFLITLTRGPVASGSPAAGRTLDVRRDTFAFANETVFKYGVDERGELHISKREAPPEYAHRCFVMSRAVLQFWQFARFDPRQPRASREEYVRIIRRISRIPVWSEGPRESIVVPGFADLHEMSEKMPALLQEHLGTWFPSYIRVGNFRMAMGHPRAGQAAAARWLRDSLASGHPRAVYLARFPHMNHCVVVYGMEQTKRGERFWLYDPNYPAEPAWLDYVENERSFEFQRRWYFPGGRVNVMRTYISPFH